MDGQCQLFFLCSSEHTVGCIEPVIVYNKIFIKYLIEYFKSQVSQITVVQDAEMMEQIDRDVMRTHPDMHFFSGDDPTAVQHREAQLFSYRAAY